MIKRIDLYNGGSCLALQCSCPAEKITDKLLIYSPFKVERKKKKRERKKERKQKQNKQTKSQQQPFGSAHENYFLSACF